MSLKGDKYETAEEVKFRLENSIVMYDGEPVYITQCLVPDREDKGEVARVYFRKLPVGGAVARGMADPEKDVRKYLSSKKFDLAPFKMGYFNHGGSAHFISRTPIRQNRQGLAQGNCKFTDVRGNQTKDMGFATALGSKGFVDMISGNYPEFKEAGALLDEKGTASVAVSRSFAFHIDHDLEALMLLHRGVKCGIAMRNQKGLQIPPKFHFLKEEMEECRIPLA